MWLSVCGPAATFLLGNLSEKLRCNVVRYCKIFLYLRVNRIIYLFINMVKTHYFGAYSAPVCEFAEESLEALLCQSPGGLTEEFGGDVPFNW